jgi:hypothetical protein
VVVDVVLAVAVAGVIFVDHDHDHDHGHGNTLGVPEPNPSKDRMIRCFLPDGMSGQYGMCDRRTAIMIELSRSRRGGLRVSARISLAHKLHAPATGDGVS